MWSKHLTGCSQLWGHCTHTILNRENRSFYFVMNQKTDNFLSILVFISRWLHDVTQLLHSSTFSLSYRYLLWFNGSIWYTRHPSAVRVGGQHPPFTRGLSAGPNPSPQRSALPAGNARVCMDTHATPLWLWEDQVRMHIFPQSAMWQPYMLSVAYKKSITLLDAFHRGVPFDHTSQYNTWFSLR